MWRLRPIFSKFFPFYHLHLHFLVTSDPKKKWFFYEEHVGTYCINMATWPHLLCIICTSPIFLVTSENSPKKQLLGGGGGWGRPAVFFISTNFDPQKNWEIFEIWFFYCKFDYCFLKFSNFSTSQNWKKIKSLVRGVFSSFLFWDRILRSLPKIRLCCLKMGQNKKKKKESKRGIGIVKQSK